MTGEVPSYTGTGLYRISGIAALVIVGFMPIQMVVFVMHPPPTTVSQWFSLYHENWMVALLDMDLLLNSLVLAFPEEMMAPRCP